MLKGIDVISTQWLGGMCWLLLEIFTEIVLLLGKFGFEI